MGMSSAALAKTPSHLDLSALSGMRILLQVRMHVSMPFCMFTRIFQLLHVSKLAQGPIGRLTCNQSSPSRSSLAQGISQLPLVSVL